MLISGDKDRTFTMHIGPMLNTVHLCCFKQYWKKNINKIYTILDLDKCNDEDISHSWSWCFGAWKGWYCSQHHWLQSPVASYLRINGLQHVHIREEEKHYWECLCWDEWKMNINIPKKSWMIYNNKQKLYSILYCYLASSIEQLDPQCKPPHWYLTFLLLILQ
jgi:hypothetical protein